MIRPAPAVTPSLAAGSPASTDRLNHHRWMLLSRRLEERLRSLYRQGRITGGVYLGLGQEALAAATGMCLQPGDVYAPLIRDAAGRLAFGEDPVDFLRHYLGRATGAMRGRDGNIHRGQVDQGQLPMISHLGAMIPTTVGVLMARRLKGETGVVGVASIGDGGMNTGAAHEGLNAAAVHGLPLVLMVANNGYAYSTPNDESFACADLLDRAQGYGVAGHGCDGTDPQACLTTVSTAIAAARDTGKPQLVVARLLRLNGHGEHDDARYISDDDKERFGDCLPLGAEQLKADDLVTDAELATWDDEIIKELDSIVDQVLAEPEPDPAAETWSAYAGRWPFVGGQA